MLIDFKCSEITFGIYNNNEISLPLDVARIIFEQRKRELSTMALVSKIWKAVADDDILRKSIRPSQAFGTQEWLEYIGVDTGQEPLLPRRAYGDINEKHILTFIPGIVKENGLIEEMPLDSLNAIRKLFTHQKQGYKADYNQNVPSEVLLKNRKVEKPHWVLINREAVGQRQNESQQQQIIKDMNKNIPGTHVSELMDTVISIFMDFIKNGHSYHNINCNESIDRFQKIEVHFELSKLKIGNSSFRFVMGEGYSPHYNSFLFAWRSF